LDINVLLALLDSDHVDHEKAKDWLDSEITYGWASCAITQNGFVRIISQPRYPSPVSPALAIERLTRAATTEHHQFWPCSVTLLDGRAIRPEQIHGPRQVTDAYLLALAVAHGGRFVTLDQSVAPGTVPGAKPDDLAVL
jgi:toxin-antitoxin system PIN domain toxin